MQPAGWDNFIGYNYKATNPMGGLGAVADGTHTHNGSKLAAHFKSDGGMVFLERPLPSGTNHLFVRAYFYMTRQLGMGPSGREPRVAARHPGRSQERRHGGAVRRDQGRRGDQPRSER